MRVLITGVTGFVGGHMAEALLAEGSHDVWGLSRQNHWPREWSHLQKQVPLHLVDWSDETALVSFLEENQPQWIIHLAAYANSGTSIQEPETTWRANFSLTKSLYEAILRSRIQPRILFVSSGLIYGESDFPNQPSDERTTLKPGNPYATSKAAADLLSYQYTRNPRLDIVRARPFNHIGPKQSPDYAAPNFARQLVAIEKGQQPPVVETGDLSGQRDLSDVRDVVQAYLHLLRKGTSGEAYNIGSGTTYRMQEILDLLVDMTQVPVEVRQKLDPNRQGESVVTRADIRKIQQFTGWQPKIPIRETLQDMLEDWRKR